MFDVLKRVTAARLAAAGREARREVVATAGQIGAQVADAAATAAGELVRCAVAGAITAAVRGGHRTPPVSTGVWDHTEFDADDFGDDGADTPPVPAPEPGSAALSPRWARASRVASRALTVAAGAAASVPGGRLVAAGLGAAAAVVGLAARAVEDAPTDDMNDNN